MYEKVLYNIVICKTIIVYLYVTIRSTLAQNGDHRNYFVKIYRRRCGGVSPIFGAAETSNTDFSSNEIGLTSMFSDGIQY